MKKIFTLLATAFIGTAVYCQTVTISNVVNPLCNGQCTGSATANQSGFVPTGTYSWNCSPAQTTQTATNLCAGTYTVTVTNGISTATATVTITQPTLLVATESHTNVSCFGGSNGTATAVASGGTPNYSYSWNTVPVQSTQTATGLMPGSYTCTVTDNNGCSTTVVSTITQPGSAVSATGSGTNVSCFGGSDGTTTASPSGGTSPYSFSWNTVPAQTTATATGLMAGVYSATITDANGCATSVAVTITQPTTAVSATSSSTSISCNGGSNGTASVVASGGTPNYTYMWSPSGGTSATATALSAGTYSNTITDANGCTTTVTVAVTQPAVLAANVTMIMDSCNGVCDGVALANPTGGTAPFTYLWTTNTTAQNDSNLCAGNHGVVVTDANGCTANQIFTITEPSVLSVTTTEVDANCVGCTNGTATVTASGGTGPYSYLWSPGSQTTATAAGLGMGTYVVCVTDANGCAQVCDSVFVNDGTGIATHDAISGLTIYPNPTSGNINIVATAAVNGAMTVTLRDVTGKIIFSEHYAPVVGVVKQYNLENQSAGFYFMEIQNGNSRMTQKIIKY